MTKLKVFGGESSVVEFREIVCNPSPEMEVHRRESELKLTTVVDLVTTARILTALAAFTYPAGEMPSTRMLKSATTSWTV